MNEILDIAGQVAGIGGLAIASMLLIFRDILRKNIFPQMTKDQGYRTINRIALLAFFIALTGVIAWTTSGMFATYRETQSPEGDVRHSDFVAQDFPNVVNHMIAISNRGTESARNVSFELHCFKRDKIVLSGEPYGTKIVERADLVTLAAGLTIQSAIVETPRLMASDYFVVTIQSPRDQWASWEEYLEVVSSNGGKTFTMPHFQNLAWD